LIFHIKNVERCAPEATHGAFLKAPRPRHALVVGFCQVTEFISTEMPKTTGSTLFAQQLTHEELSGIAVNERDII